MQARQHVLFWTLVTAFLISVSFALYYREQATRYRKEWDAAVSLLNM